MVFIKGIRQVSLDEAGLTDTMVARNDEFQAFDLTNQSHLRSEGSFDLTLGLIGFQINNFDEA